MGRRLVAIGFVMAVTSVATCVSTKTDECADGTICAEGRSCFEITAGEFRCVVPSQISACEDGDAACVGGGGACRGLDAQACFVALCGDGVIDSPEICDDANLEDGDGCARTCLSKEVCGNTVIDLINGEQCDDGAPGLAGDGCTFTCSQEFWIWRDAPFGPPPGRYAFGVAADPIDGVLLWSGSVNIPVFLSNGSAAGATFGDSQRWSSGGWQSLVPRTSAPRRTRFSYTADRSHGRVLVYGGMNALGQRTSDAWSWNGIDWTQLAASSPAGARADASLACSPNRCLLFGGTQGSASVSLPADAWTWNGTTFTPFENTGTSGSPIGRAQGALVYHQDDGRFVLFGGTGSGAGSGSALGDTWEIVDGETAWVTINSVSPPASRTPTAAYDEVRKKIVLVVEGTTWTYDTATKWAPAGALNAPSPTLAWDPKRRVVIATYRGSSSSPMQIREFNGTSWDAPILEALPSGGANGAATAYDERRGRTLLLDAGTNFLEGSPTGWRRLPPAPTFRISTALVYDATCDRTVKFGGAEAALTTNVTSVFDANTSGSAWSTLPGATPSARKEHAMAYDRVGDRIVLFGGIVSNDQSTALDDLWVYSGPCNARTWTQVARTGAWPSERSGHSLVFDRKRGALVMFGGTNAEGALLGDTWFLEGTTWTQFESPDSPSPRTEHMSAFEPRGERVIVFGGTSEQGPNNETWALDTTWARITTVLTTNTRASGSMARDLTGGLMVIGGTNGVEILSPVVRLRSELGVDAIDRCVDDRDDDGDALVGCADPDCWSRCEPMCRYGETCTGPRCGDGECSLVEDFAICPVDCPAP